LPADACVRGRFIVQQVTASDGSSVTLYLFTTLELTVEQLVQLYGQRWNVETDLRSLKRTVDLQVLRCKSADMIAKELVLAIVGYNLVRAVMNAAAEEYKLDPRRLSFSRSQDVVNAALPRLGRGGHSGRIPSQSTPYAPTGRFLQAPRSQGATLPTPASLGAWLQVCKAPRRGTGEKLKDFLGCTTSHPVLEKRVTLD